ncbi:unnamed protein product [Nesidiocoris tenuis]|uniref:Uncharacterized protein n=1 Tax=Nesidiocoris tenuis TaxID=355587 RepID=A0A6H5GAB0_9HEMI|nr:unnamed protein product [Nesidiocoris tenuis]
MGRPVRPIRPVCSWPRLFRRRNRRADGHRPLVNLGRIETQVRTVWVKSVANGGRRTVHGVWRTPYGGRPMADSVQWTAYGGRRTVDGVRWAYEYFKLQGRILLPLKQGMPAFLVLLAAAILPMTMGDYTTARAFYQKHFTDYDPYTDTIPVTEPDADHFYHQYDHGHPMVTHGYAHRYRPPAHMSEKGLDVTSLGILAIIKLLLIKVIII